MPETSEIIASLEALSAEMEGDRDPVLAHLDALTAVRIPLQATDPLPRVLLELERAAGRIPEHRRRPLQQIREAVDLVRLNGELVSADTLLLADLERTHSRVVGPIGTGLRALRALRALDDPHVASLETALMHLDRDPSEWPTDRDSDPQVQAIRGLVTQLEAIVAADAPALARLYQIWRCITDGPLTRSTLNGTAADKTNNLAGDDPTWLRQVDALNDTDPRRMLAAVALSWGAARIRWTQGRDLCIAATLRSMPHPLTDRPDPGLAWMAQVYGQAAELTRLELVRIGHAIDQIERDAGGQRDRSRSTLIDHLCARPVTTAAYLADDADVTRRTAMRLMNRLAAAGSCRWKGMRETGRVIEATRLLS